MHWSASQQLTSDALERVIGSDRPRLTIRGIMVTRREVVSVIAGVTGITSLGIPVAAAQAPGRRPDLRLQKGEKLVMIGDSITDVGRARPIGEGRADDALGR